MPSRPVRTSLLTTLAAALTLTVVSPVTALAQAAAPTSVTIAGSFQSELGCPGDWQPECATPRLSDADGDGTWTGTFTIPAGDWKFKAALDGAWTTSYPGDDVALSTSTAREVTFTYVEGTNAVTHDAPAAGGRARPGAARDDQAQPARGPHRRGLLLRPARPLPRRGPHEQHRRDRGRPAEDRLRQDRPGLLPRRRPQGPAEQDRLPRGPGRHRHLDGAGLQEPAGAGRRRRRDLRRLPRLLDGRLHADRPALRHQRRARAAHRRGARPRHQGLLRHHHQPHRGRRQVPGGRLRLHREVGRAVPRRGRQALRRPRLRGQRRLPRARRGGQLPVHAGGPGGRAEEDARVAQRPDALPQPR